MMPPMVHLTEARVDHGQHTAGVRLALVNKTTNTLGPGGVRFLAVDKRGGEHKLSAFHLWPVPAGETIVVYAHLGNVMRDFRTVRLKSFAYVEFSGPIHELPVSVAVGLMSGTKIEYES